MKYCIMFLSITVYYVYYYVDHEIDVFMHSFIFFFKQKTAYEVRISDWSQTCALPICAAAVLLPPQPRPDAAAGAVLDGLDGLILTGGLDVQPELYGAERHPLTDPARPDRDAWELSLLRGARERGIPVFGICRGLQLINVAFGGTLHQHLPEALGTERYRVGGGVFARNVVSVEDGTRLAGLVGAGELAVHSYHHQIGRAHV